MSPHKRDEAPQRDAALPIPPHADLQAEVEAQTATLTLPVAIDADSREPRRRYARFPLGVVGGVSAFYSGDELHPDEERLLRTILETAYRAGGAKPVTLPGDLLVKWLTGEINDEETRFARDALTRLTEATIEFVQESGAPRSTVVWTRRCGAIQQLEMFEVVRRSKGSSITVCSLVVEPAVAGFMVAGRSPFLEDPLPTAGR